MSTIKHRIYYPGDWQPGMSFALNAKAANHLARVLRLKQNDKICLFNGEGLEAIASLVDVAKREVNVSIDSCALVSKESPLKLHLAQAISKGDRMDFVVQKAVELGVSTITPIITERCVVKLDQQRIDKKLAHWQAVIESASEQCGRNHLATLSPVIKLDELLVNQSPATCLFLHPENTKPMRTHPQPDSKLTLIIGPEGGFSAAEVDRLNGSASAISLGPRVLRTETAALTALSLAQSLWGDL